MTKRRMKYQKRLAAERREMQSSVSQNASGSDLERQLLETLGRVAALLLCLRAAGDDDAPPPHCLS